jgi:phospholipase C
MGSSASFPCSHNVWSKKRTADAYKKKYGHPRPDIDHVVVLMLENRTFDNLLGSWMDRRMQKGEVKPSKWDVHAKKGKRLYEYTNTVVPDGENEEKGVKFPVWSRDPKREDIHSQQALGCPSGDPAEKYELLNLCMFGTEDPASDEKMIADGFAQQYYEREIHDKNQLGETWADQTDFHNKRSPAMHVFLPEQVPVITELAEAFGVSDTYFASAPCQTWPNRLFASVGHSYGYVNNFSDFGEAYDHDKMNKQETMKRVAQFSDETVFQRLQNHGVEWAIYGGDYPLALMLNQGIQGVSGLSRVYCQDDFLEHARAGDLPAFSWIEPQFLKGSDGSFPTDMHPPHGVRHGQKLIAEVYNALRSNEEAWAKTLLIINCDEGVGLFDHVPPPEAVEPKHAYFHRFHGQKRPSQFESNPFHRYGTRTLCLLASPLIDPRSVLRPDEETCEDHGKYPFDHTSILRTVFDLFVDPDCHLANRDKIAPSFAPYLQETAGNDLGPQAIQVPNLEHTLLMGVNTDLAALKSTTRQLCNLTGKDGQEKIGYGCHAVGFFVDGHEDGSLHISLHKALDFLKDPSNRGRQSHCNKDDDHLSSGTPSDDESEASR